MSKNYSPFKFKHFSVSHHQSSMKVGVDGVLIGSWVEVEGATKVLDVGTGCGLIALMLAQRCPTAKVIGIDIDEASIDEAEENVATSIWAERISVLQTSFQEFIHNESQRRFDLIVSNPPFFDSGVTNTITSREKARHQGSLSPTSLLVGSSKILIPGGSLAMVVPSELYSDLDIKARELGFMLMKSCFVRGHEGAPYKRCLLQWKLSENASCAIDTENEYLTLEQDRGVPTEEYRSLCKDFYLKF